MKLSEVKPELESCKRENAKLKAQIERERSRADRAQVSADNREIEALTQRVDLEFCLRRLWLLVSFYTNA